MGVDVLSTDLTKVARVRAYVGQSVMSGQHDADLAQVVHAASAHCHRFCRRDSFLQDTYTHDGDIAGGNRERLDGDGGRELFLCNTPVTSITEIKRRYDESALTEGPDEEFTLDPWTGRIYMRWYRFPDEPQSIEVTYVGGYQRENDGDANTRVVFGYLERAQDLEQSVVKMAAALWHRRKRERDGIKSMSTDGGTFTFDDSAIPKDVRDVWTRYRHAEVA
jgi:hypothetical protein